MRVKKNLSPLQIVNGLAKNVLMLKDIILEADGGFRRPGDSEQLFPRAGVDLRWRFDPERSSIIIDFFRADGSLVPWRWDEVKIPDDVWPSAAPLQSLDTFLGREAGSLDMAVSVLSGESLAAQDAAKSLAGMGHVGRFTFVYTLERVTKPYSNPQGSHLDRPSVSPTASVTSWHSISSEDDDVFHSFKQSDSAEAFEEDFERQDAQMMTETLPPALASPAATGKKLPRRNGNKVSQFAWLEELFQLIAAGPEQNAERPTPLFVVAGTCPNAMCGMQAVAFFRMPDRSVDLWWVKPQKSDPDRLEVGTLIPQSKGPFKNDAGARVKALYAPLIERFSSVSDQGLGNFAFGVDASTGRAFIDERAPGQARMLPYLIWQESWSGATARKKFIAGQICYQKAGGGDLLFSRQYRIADGDVMVAPHYREEGVASLLPPESLQEMYDSID